MSITVSLSVNPETLANIRQHIEPIELAIAEIENRLEYVWEGWDDYYLYEVVVEKFKDLKVFLSNPNQKDITG